MDLVRGSWQGWATVVGLLLLIPGSTLHAETARPRSAEAIESDLETEVRDAQIRAGRIGQATAGSGDAAVGACVLGVCMEEAPAVGEPGMVEMDLGATTLGDFSKFLLCKDVENLTAQLLRESDPEKRSQLSAELRKKQALITPYIQREYCDKMTR